MTEEWYVENRSKLLVISWPVLMLKFLHSTSLPLGNFGLMDLFVLLYSWGDKEEGWPRRMSSKAIKFFLASVGWQILKLSLLLEVLFRVCWVLRFKERGWRMQVEEPCKLPAFIKTRVGFETQKTPTEILTDYLSPKFSHRQ